MGNMDIYNKLKTPPAEALKPIDYGPLKGKSDINPQWRYEAMTQQFGACGVGWSFSVDKYWTQNVEATGEVMVFVQISLFVKVENEWSNAIPGWGGDFLVIKDKNGIHGNDEAMKMAVTDALGTACKMIGLAADVYRGNLNGKSDSKYSRRDEKQKQQENNDITEHSGTYATEKQVGLIKTIVTKFKINTDSILNRYKVANLESLSKEQASDCIRVLKMQTGE